MDPKLRLAEGRSPLEVTQGFKEVWPQKESVGSTADDHCEVDSRLTGMLKAKITSFSDILGLPPRNLSTTLPEFLMGTLEDLESMYRKCISCIRISEINRESTHEVLLHFYKVLKSVGDLWTENCNQSGIFNVEKEVDLETLSSQQLGERVLERLNYMSSRAREMFRLIEKNSVNAFSQQGKPSYFGSPLTPTSVLPETSECHLNLKESPNIAYLPPLLRPLRLQAVGKLKPMDVKRLSVHMFPLVLDQNSPVHQTDKIDGDLKVDFVEAVMCMEPISDDITGNDDDGDSETRSFETTILLSTPTTPRMLQLRNPLLESSISSSPSSPMTLSEVVMPLTPHIRPPMSMGPIPHATSKNGGGDRSKSSEATILVSPPSLPMLHLRAPVLQSATPTPPPSPMVLKGLYMPLRPYTDPSLCMESIAYAMTVNDIDNDTIYDFDNDNRCKPSEATILVSPPSTPISQLKAAPLQSPPPPPPLLSMPQANTPIPPAPITSTPKEPSQPPSPPALQSRFVPTPPPPPPPKGHASSTPLPPLLSLEGSAPPPPPSLGVLKALRAKKANTKLKRSTQMGNLYRLLKGKVEGSSLNGASQRRKSQIGGSSGGNKAQGMADALAEITKRSAYFRQIEEDVEKHAAAILELKSTIGSFRTKDMTELIKFHQHVELHLENLTDETQVLARFEDFPSKKLETIRMAVALYSKLDVIATTLKSWKVVAPIAQQLDKVESYFNKIKDEVDATERNKEEESKRFQSHNIDFDFSALIRIKESMVDVSSNCIEMALKESKEAKEVVGEVTSKSNSLSKMLWRAFQLAFRVYSFAGGQDDRADRLTSELAHEIETYSQF